MPAVLDPLLRMQRAPATARGIWRRRAGARRCLRSRSSAYPILASIVLLVPEVDAGRAARFDPPGSGSTTTSGCGSDPASRSRFRNSIYFTVVEVIGRRRDRASSSRCSSTIPCRAATRSSASSSSSRGRSPGRERGPLEVDLQLELRDPQRRPASSSASSTSTIVWLGDAVRRRSTCSCSPISGSRSHSSRSCCSPVSRTCRRILYRAARLDGAGAWQRSAT